MNCQRPRVVPGIHGREIEPRVPEASRALNISDVMGVGLPMRRMRILCRSARGLLADVRRADRQSGWCLRTADRGAEREHEDEQEQRGVRPRVTSRATNIFPV
jgi:hypothetical protein